MEVWHTHGWLPSPHGWVVEISSAMWVPMFGKSLILTAGMCLAFAVGGNHVVPIFWGEGENGAGGGQACVLGKVHEEGDHFLVALVRPEPLALQPAEWVVLKSTLLHAHLPPSRRWTVRETPSLNYRAV
jgi:hypothetical protein